MNASGFVCVLPLVNAIPVLNIGAIAEANGLLLSEAQIAQLHSYARLLVEWNARVNLISRKDEANVFASHILHALTLTMPSVMTPQLSESAAVFDLGTGGGLPGIPMKIARPDLTIVLCDSIRKKISAVQSMIQELQLEGISAVLGRAEDLATSLPKFDVIVSRAVAPLENLVQWTSAIVKPGAKIYALKGGDLKVEIAQAGRNSRVRAIQVKPLLIANFNGFVDDEKKLLIVELR